MIRVEEDGEVVVDLSIMPGETCIKVNLDKFFCHQASRANWLCQLDPATTVCVEEVPKKWVVVALFLIFHLLRIRSKSAKSIKVCVPANGEGGVVSEAVPPSLGETIVKSHDHLLAVSRQRLIMSGDVETNPGPLDQGRCGLLCWCPSQKIYLLCLFLHYRSRKIALYC